MEQSQREKRASKIDELCEQAGCNEKRRKLHYEQFVDRGWNPHPSQDFVEWWKTHPHNSGASVVMAYNTKRYRDEFADRVAEHANPKDSLNYPKHGWHKPEEQPRTSAPEILQAHEEWKRRKERLDRIGGEAKEYGGA